MAYRLALAALIVLVSTTGAFAGGLYIQEFATPEMGHANAGSEALAEGPQTLIFNPAGLARVEGTQLIVTGGLAFSSIEFDPDRDTPASGGDGGDAGSIAPLGGAYFSTPITSDLVLGVGVFSVSAAVLDYDDDWAGRYEVTDVSIFTITGGISLGYRVNENVLIGAGGGMLYGKLDMELFAPPLDGNARATLDGDDVVGIWNVGVLFEISEKTRIGATYWSDMELDFDGDLEIDRAGIDVDVNTKIKYPRFIRLGIYHELDEDWDILASVRWEDWSEMDEVLLSGESRDAALARNWDDTWHGALGCRYRLCDGWTLSAGVAYDTSPVESYDRTADMPVDRQIRINAGALWQYSEDLALGASIEYLDLGDAAIKSSLLKGDFETNAAIFLGVNAWWKW